MAIKSMTQVQRRFVDFHPEGHEALARSTKPASAMLSQFGESSRFKDFRRKLAFESPEGATPSGFFRSEKPAGKQIESRNLQIWKLRRLEKKRLWLQDIVMVCQAFMHNWTRLSPFRSFDDQLRLNKRKPMTVLATPRSRAVRLHSRKKPLASRLRAS